jgi:mannose-6-phosphate isomerase-like protein (cupin superfamily)
LSAELQWPLEVNLPLPPLEIYYLTAGERQRLCGDKIKRVRAGDVVYLPANQVHGIRTIDDQPLELVWMFPTNTYTEIVYHEDVAFID